MSAWFMVESRVIEQLAIEHFFLGGVCCSQDEWHGRPSKVCGDEFDLSVVIAMAFSMTTVSSAWDIQWIPKIDLKQRWLNLPRAYKCLRYTTNASKGYSRNVNTDRHLCAVLNSCLTRDILFGSVTSYT